ncbi:MAG: TlpA family protein disulfide reductase [Chitinophagaceae bacterium]|nr:TlpA family protein disulfide reductase [Chitinophagaceae bacterium]
MMGIRSILGLLAMLMMATPQVLAQQAAIKVYDFAGLQPMLHQEGERLQIVNFWAMWCAPCVAELPYLQAYANAHPEVDLLLVSMDFPKDIKDKLKPFLKKRGITAQVVMLDDPDANTWIDKIDKNWSGAIPFTIIYNKEQRGYHERAFDSVAEVAAAVAETMNTKN